MYINKTYAFAKKNIYIQVALHRYLFVEMKLYPYFLISIHFDTPCTSLPDHMIYTYWMKSGSVAFNADHLTSMLHTHTRDYIFIPNNRSCTYTFDAAIDGM